MSYQILKMLKIFTQVIFIQYLYLYLYLVVKLLSFRETLYLYFTSFNSLMRRVVILMHSCLLPSQMPPTEVCSTRVTQNLLNKKTRHGLPILQVFCVSSEVPHSSACDGLCRCLCSQLVLPCFPWHDLPSPLSGLVQKRTGHAIGESRGCFPTGSVLFSPFLSHGEIDFDSIFRKYITHFIVLFVICRCWRTMVSAHPIISPPSPPLASTLLVLASLGFLKGPTSASLPTLTAPSTTRVESPTAIFSSTAKLWTGAAKPARL